MGGVARWGVYGSGVAGGCRQSHRFDLVVYRSGTVVGGRRLKWQRWVGGRRRVGRGAKLDQPSSFFVLPFLLSLLATTESSVFFSAQVFCNFFALDEVSYFY
jgi:hypothetical protein